MRRRACSRTAASGATSCTSATSPRANLRALLAPDPIPGAFNVASGTPHTVLEMAEALADAFEGAPRPVVTGDWRGGDVRHIVASADRAAGVLGFRARVDFAAGMREFARAALR